MKHDNYFNSLKVVDLSSVLAGPSVGSFFAELGAEVLKIENPNHPDVTKSWKLPLEKEESVSAYFSSINYKKKYLQIDYQKEEGRQELFNHIAEADLLLMNFKPALQTTLGLEEETLRSINRKLIIGKITGFGNQSNRVAYDLILQAETGFMSMNGTPDSGPVKMPVALIDVLAAHHLKEGILIELIHKMNCDTYTGKTISVSLYDAAVSSLVNQASNYLMARHIPQRIGSLHPNIAPYGEIFETKDRKQITFAIGSNTHFQKLCDFLNEPELAQQEAFKKVTHRVKNRRKLFDILFPLIRQFDSKTLLHEMRKRNIPCGEIKNLKEVFETSEAQKLIRTEKINEVTTQRVTGIAFKSN